MRHTQGRVEGREGLGGDFTFPGPLFSRLSVCFSNVSMPPNADPTCHETGAQNVKGKKKKKKAKTAVRCNSDKPCNSRARRSHQEIWAIFPVARFVEVADNSRLMAFATSGEK